MPRYLNPLLVHILFPLSSSGRLPESITDTDLDSLTKQLKAFYVSFDYLTELFLSIFKKGHTENKTENYLSGCFPPVFVRSWVYLGLIHLFSFLTTFHREEQQLWRCLWLLV